MCPSIWRALTSPDVRLSTECSRFASTPPGDLLVIIADRSYEVFRERGIRVFEENLDREEPPSAAGCLTRCLGCWVEVTTMSVPMAAIPLYERPRERLLALGAEGLADRELLAVVLGQGTQGKSALDLASELLAEYGSLERLAAARPEELSARMGIGVAKSAALAAAFQLGRRAERSHAVPTTLKAPEDVALVARRELCDGRRERVLVLVCDSGNRLLRTVVVSEGSVDRSLLPVREVLNAVLRHDGRSFALAHNHPSGDPEPSDADRRVTEEIRAAAKLAGLRFLGHVVVAGREWRSIK
jgi:DNA repair protein RadC